MAIDTYKSELLHLRNRARGLEPRVEPVAGTEGLVQPGPKPRALFRESNPDLVAGLGCFLRPAFQALPAPPR